MLLTTGSVLVSGHHHTRKFCGDVLSRCTCSSITQEAPQLLCGFACLIDQQSSSSSAPSCGLGRYRQVMIANVDPVAGCLVGVGGVALTAMAAPGACRHTG